MSTVQRGGPCPEMLRLQREEIATLRQELDAEERLVGILRRAASRRERTLVALQRRLDGALTNRDEPRSRRAG